MTKWFEDLKTKRAALDKMIKEEGKTELHKVFKEFFEANPSIKAIMWPQFTPYFNDGEPCIFSVHEPVFLLNEPDEDKGYWDYEGDTVGVIDAHGKPGDYVYENHKKNPTDSYYKNRVENYENNKVAADNAAKFYQNVFEKDLLEQVFGDHVMIVATPNGFDVQEFEHD